MATDETRARISQHVAHLRAAWAALLVAAVGALAVMLAAPPPAPAQPAAHAGVLLWGAVLLVVLNLVTVMPVYRAMLAGPRRVYAVSHDVGPLLAAHRHAHLVALARTSALAVVGLVVFVLTGQLAWSWPFAALAIVGAAVLWPVAAKVMALAQPTAAAPGS